MNAINADERNMEREMQAFLTSLALLKACPEPSIAIAATLVLFRGSSRVLNKSNAPLLLALCRRFGKNTGLGIGLALGFFQHPDRPLHPALGLDLNNMSDADCTLAFRFDHSGIKKLVVLLSLPDVIRIPVHRDRTSAIEGICIVLDRMVYPKRWHDLSKRYRRHVSSLSRIFLYMMHIILRGIKHRLMFSRTNTESRIRTYLQAFWRRGVPRAMRIWAVIDVKKVANCRPSHNQRAQYSGHTKYHCFKYQTLETPDGRTCSLAINEMKANSLESAFISFSIHITRHLDSDFYCRDNFSLLSLSRWTQR